MESNSTKGSEFIIEQEGPPDLFGVFEDDGETGYLYLYEPNGRGVFHHLHIYDRTPNLAVQEQDVRVTWSDDLAKVGVQIWGKLRGIINVATGQELRVRLQDHNTAGIGGHDWLKGFESTHDC